MPRPKLERNTESHTYRVFYFLRSGGEPVKSAQFDYVAARRDGGIPYLPDVGAYLRGLRDQGGPGRLPGISGEWTGYMMVYTMWTKDKHSDPFLIPPVFSYPNDE